MTTPVQKHKITEWVAVDSKTGEFQRKASVFRDAISRAPGAQFPPEKGRYHLYVSYACPWAHRSQIIRELKGLQDIISLSVVHWHMGSKGWRFATQEEVAESPEMTAAPEPLNGATYLQDIYFKADPQYSGRYTVPILWDKKTNTIVNNESSEIIRFLYTEFDDLVDEKFRGNPFYPEDKRGVIDELNSWVYDTINNGVYKSGIATKQGAYEDAVTALFASLDRVEALLKSSTGPYLLGEKITEADVRLYPTIIRFDPVYVQHFKCNIGMIRHDYPAIHKWLRHLYWEVPAFKETTNFEHIKKHYTKSHAQINPTGVTPLGPLPYILPQEV